MRALLIFALALANTSCAYYLHSFSDGENRAWYFPVSEVSDLGETVSLYFTNEGGISWGVDSAAGPTLYFPLDHLNTMITIHGVNSDTVMQLCWEAERTLGGGDARKYDITMACHRALWRELAGQ